MMIPEGWLNNVIQGDCLELMKELPDKCVDLVLADPPYGIGETWSKNRNDRFYKKGKLYKYNNRERLTQPYFQEMVRISHNQIIWGGNYFTDFLPPTNSWIFWNKQISADASHMSEGELAWTSYSKVLRVADYLWNGARKCEKVDKIHPHQKPVKLCRWTLERFLNEPPKIILDPYAGSASFLIACIQLGIDFLAFEIEPKYVEIAKKRIAAEKAQLKIF